MMMKDLKHLLDNSSRLIENNPSISQEALLDTLCQPEYLQTVMTIIGQKDAIIPAAIRKHLSPALQQLAEKHDMKVEENSQTYNNQLVYSISFYPKDWSANRSIRFDFESSNYYGFRWGIFGLSRQRGKRLSCFKMPADIDYPHGWSYCEGFTDWNDPETLERVMNGELVKRMDGWLESCCNEISKEGTV